MKGKLFLIMGILLIASYFLYEYKGRPNTGKEKEPPKIVTGTINNTNGNPVSKATIYLLGTEIKAYSDKNGEYSIEAREGDELIVSHPMYNKKSIEVKGPKENITLATKGSDLKEKIQEEFPNLDIQ